MRELSRSHSHGGAQISFEHESMQTRCTMVFSIFVPGGATKAVTPLIWYLPGSSCSPQQAAEKGEFRAACERSGIAFVIPDSSPRGSGLPVGKAGVTGEGAGFYLDATKTPWSDHFRMRSYLETELPELISTTLPVDMTRQSIMGHSMGGHGALTIALRNPGRFRSVSALAPVASLMSSASGPEVLETYLGANRETWRPYDACALLKGGARVPALLVDQGDSDEWLADELKLDLLTAACQETGQPATIRLQPGYDHSYYFVSTFMSEHVAWHAERLQGARLGHD